jgi:2-methylisocitrate lyase-like PEP mutase family enzyme
MSEAAWRVDRQNLRKLVGGLDGRILVAIGVANGAEARQLHHTICELQDQQAVPDYVGGFVFFVSGFLCAAEHGLPDLGYILRSEIARQIDIIEQATWMAALDTGTPAFPIGVDIDTGYGNEPSSVLLTCRQVHKQGAQYVQIEDQFSINKSCGHMEGSRGLGKEIVSAEEMIERRLAPAIRYARSQNDLMVMARTDALAVDGFDEALRRARLYAEAGAEILFVEAPENDGQLEQIPREFAGSDVLNVANMIEGGPKTPYRSPGELHRMGYQVALYSIGSLLAGRAAQRRYYGILGRGESVMRSDEVRPEHWFKGFDRVIGHEQTEAWNRMFQGDG